MRRTLLTLAAVLVAGFLVWECGVVKLCDGGFDLTVRVEGRDRPRSVSCQAFGRRDPAWQALALLLPPESSLWSAAADPFDERPLTVRVPVSCRESPLGRQFHRYLVVIATMPDGERVGKPVDIPDGRESREVSVGFP